MDMTWGTLLTLFLNKSKQTTDSFSHVFIIILKPAYLNNTSVPVYTLRKLVLKETCLLFPNLFKCWQPLILNSSQLPPILRSTLLKAETAHFQKTTSSSSSLETTSSCIQLFLSENLNLFRFTLAQKEFGSPREFTINKMISFPTQEAFQCCLTGKCDSHAWSSFSPLSIVIIVIEGVGGKFVFGLTYF